MQNCLIRSRNMDRLVPHPGLSQNDEHWQNIFLNIKKNMQGSEEEKEMILRKRLLKFFHNYSIQENRYYTQRREINLGTNSLLQISNNSLMLYGIDFLNQRKLQQYFSPLAISVDFYDDSHCSVTFGNYSQMISAFYNHLKEDNKPKQFQTFCQSATASTAKKVEWIELVGYFELSFERKLWARFLTNQDYKYKSQNQKRQNHQSYLSAKSIFLKQFQEKSEERIDVQKSRKSFGSRSSSQRSISRSRDSKYLNGKSKYSGDYSYQCPCIQKVILRQVRCKCKCNNKDAIFHDNKQLRKSIIYRNTSKEQNKGRDSTENRKEQPKKSYINIQDTDDHVMRSLLNELDKYHFPKQQEESFPKELSQVEKISTNASNPIPQFSDYSAFQIDYQ